MKILTKSFFITYENILFNDREFFMVFWRSFFNKYSINIEADEGRIYSKSVINLPTDISRLDNIINKLLKKRTDKIINLKFIIKNTISNIIKILKLLKSLN